MRSRFDVVGHVVSVDGFRAAFGSAVGVLLGSQNAFMVFVSGASSCAALSRSAASGTGASSDAGSTSGNTAPSAGLALAPPI